MPNSSVQINENKKNENVFPETNSMHKKHYDCSPSGKKESPQPDIKREYEKLERYIRNFSGSSF